MKITVCKGKIKMNLITGYRATLSIAGDKLTTRENLK